jgi:hypothetical protein
MPAYTHTTLLTFRSQLQARLGDGGGTFWTSAELDDLVAEALRTWNTLAKYTRNRQQLHTTASQSFYDLGVSFSGLASSLVDSDLVRVIQAHLLEPSTGTSWTGSDQFTLDMLSRSLERRRNQFLRESGMQLTQVEQVVGPPPITLVSLPDTTIDIHRVAFKPVSETYYNLWREDEHSLNAFLPSWQIDAGRPTCYTSVLRAQPSLTFAPPAANSGTLHTITTQTGASLDPSVGVALGLPDSFSWVVKWGALADLLGADGQVRDAARAQYAEERYQMGLQLAKGYSALLHTELNGAYLPLGSVFEKDVIEPDWQSATSAQPQVGLLAGYNLLALSPAPDGIYSLDIDTLVNISIPVLDGDYLQIGREFLDILLDYCQHLALFKCAGAEFYATEEHFKRFMEAAGDYNSKLRAEAPNYDLLFGRSQGEERERNRRADEVQSTAAGYSKGV